VNDVGYISTLKDQGMRGKSARISRYYLQFHAILIVGDEASLGATADQSALSAGRRSEPNR
jgi:hypothetical protein